MGRIVGRESPAPRAGLVPPDWRGAAASEDAVASARVRAARLLMDARAQARAILASAQETGRQLAIAEQRQGFEAGREEARLQGQAILSRLSSLSSSAVLAHDQTLRNAHESLIALAVAVGGAVAMRTIDEDRDTVMRVLRDALDELGTTQAAMIRVNPQDADLVEAHLPLPNLPASIEVTVVADPSIRRGGCVIEGTASYIDATLDVRLKRAEEQLRDLV